VTQRLAVTGKALLSFPFNDSLVWNEKKREEKKKDNREMERTEGRRGRHVTDIEFPFASDSHCRGFRVSALYLRGVFAFSSHL